MPVITHIVKHIFSYPFCFKIWVAREISIQRFIAYSRSSLQSRHK